MSLEELQKVIDINLKSNFLISKFFIKKMVELLNYPDCKVTFKTFKMADDAQSKQLAINLNQMGKISDKKLLTEFGFNYEAESQTIRENQRDTMEDNIFSAKKQAQAQGEAQIIATQYQIDADAEFVLDDDGNKIATGKTATPYEWQY